MRSSDLDAVTIDGYGTLLRLTDPLPALREALFAHGAERTEAEVRAAFLAEVEHYKARSHLGRDADSLAALRRDCACVFLEALQAPLKADEFVDDFMAALVFEPLPDVVTVLGRLRSAGLRLGVVANWDCALPEHLERAGLDRFFDTVVTSARAGAAKPDPAIFELALAELAAESSHALHVGDDPVDEQGARAAGMHFAPAPLATAFEGWT
jgi:putative hydrolase of the HAD superfamily